MNAEISISVKYSVTYERRFGRIEVVEFVDVVDVVDDADDAARSSSSLLIGDVYVGNVWCCSTSNGRARLASLLAALKFKYVCNWGVSNVVVVFVEGWIA